MPAAKRKPRSPAQKMAQHAANYGAGPADIAKMLDKNCSIPGEASEVPTYDARVFNRFVKAIRELEGAMEEMSFAGFRLQVNSEAKILYSESDRSPQQTVYKLNYSFSKENFPRNRD
jgi:hypothetical protein